MAKYKTHKGRVIDMEALRVQQENTVASGNMGVNAKGDKIGKDGKVIQTAADRARKGKRTSKIRKTSLKPANKDVVPEAIPEAEAATEKAVTKKPVKKTISKTKEVELDDGSIQIVDNSDAEVAADAVVDAEGDTSED